MNGNVRRINRWAVVVTGFSAFALSLVWYSPLLFGDVWLELTTTDPSAIPWWTMLVVPVRELIVAYVLAYLIVRLGVFDWRRAAGLGFGLWLAFHAVMMGGAVLWEDMPWLLGIVHAGDWLMKMLFMAVVLTLWHGKAPSASSGRAAATTHAPV